MKLDLKYKFAFGKYYGKTVTELLNTPEGFKYLLWVKNNTNHEFDKDANSEIIRIKREEAKKEKEKEKEKEKKIVLSLDSVLNFGKFKGSTVESLINSESNIKYLQWLEDNTKTAFDNDVKEKIDEWLHNFVEDNHIENEFY